MRAGADSVADFHERARLKCAERRFQFREQRAKVLNSIASRNQNNNGEWQGTEVLLIPQVLIRR